MSFLAFLIAGLIQWLISLVRPGVQINIKDQPPPRSLPTDTGVWFVGGITEKGPLVPYLVSSLSDFERTFGTRVSYGTLYDAIDVFFREGGRRAYVSRVVGPAPALATKNLLDNAAAVSLTVNAKNPGAWGSSISIAVLAGSVGGTFVLQVLFGGVVVETSPDLANTAAAIAWADQSDYINLVQGASVINPIVAAAAALVGGTDDRTNITDAQWLAALDRFSIDYGPGQVSLPGRTTDTAHTQLLNHGDSHWRAALLDLPDSSTKATLLASVVASRASRPRWGASFAPWIVYPGVTAGTKRTVAPSAMMAGIIARNDIEFTANRAAAGEFGQSVYAIGLSQPIWIDTDRQDLNNGGVNVITMKFGGVRAYGYRSLVDPVLDPTWLTFGSTRMVMEIVSRGLAVLERHLFEEIDGRGRLFGQISGELTAILTEFWDDGSLYGNTPADAFQVDTGPQVNTLATIANNEVHAAIQMKVSPMGELIVLDLVKFAPNQTIL